VLLDAIQRDIVACDRCARLREYCRRIAREKKPAHREDEYWGRPVPGFGDPAARLLILGLAPAAHGANRTGRVFTGDGSGDFLMAALNRAGFANLTTSRRSDDGLVLSDAYIAVAVRCAPPDNQPSTAELANCLPHLEREMAALQRVQVVVALGRIAFDAYWKIVRRSTGGMVRTRAPFGHARVYRPPDAPAVVASYHPSRQNTNTGRLTAPMFDQVFRKAKALFSPARRA
jgi:uracil-DNA glycosylase family 4